MRMSVCQRRIVTAASSVHVLRRARRQTLKKTMRAMNVLVSLLLVQRST
jgi:hypothetical protein